MITAAQFIQAEMQKVHKALDTAFDDLTPAQLHAVPGGNSTANTIAWNVFHCVRTEDNVVRFVLQNRRSPVWMEGGYAEKLGLPPVANGTGMSTADAHALRINDVPLFKEYTQKVWASTEELFAKHAAVLDTTVTVKGLGDMPGYQALGYICLVHAMTHIGEISMGRALAGT